MTERRRAEGMPTFAEAARRVLEQKQGGRRGPRHAQSSLRSLERYAFARIGVRPVSEVNSADVLEIITPIWHEKVETARAVRQRIRSVLEWAVAMELRADNPCDRILPVPGPQNDVVQHMRALPHGEVAAALATVRASTVAEPAVKLMFEFLVLTASRSAEARQAQWTEMDTTAQVWTVPATRMKAKREHRVPLCGRTLAILDEAQSRRRRRRAGVPQQARETGFGDDAAEDAAAARGRGRVPHGFRSSFRDWAAEETDHPREVIEAALAHVVQNKVEAAYARSDLFDRRRRLMEAWTRYVNGPQQA